jgi:REP element-mobilizing transposase RayT
MSLLSNLPNRQSTRLKIYDYSQEGTYFITIVTHDRLHLFGKIENGKMILNTVGKIIEEEWKNSILLRSNISLGEFIIMPDHMHMILTINHQIINDKNFKEWEHSNPKSPSQTIGAIIRGFKGASTKKINLLLNSTGELQFAPTIFYKNKIWQRNYYDHIIRNQIAYNRIQQYIIDNPLNWKKKNSTKF